MEQKNVLKMICAGLVLGGLSFAGAAGAAATFPDDKAGITAYVKLPAIGDDKLRILKESFFNSVESYGNHHAIGVKEYTTCQDYQSQNGKTNFHIYVGADGWIAAYLLRTEEPARLVDWDDPAGLGKTMLARIVEDTAQKIGAAIPADLAIKYYNFAYPDAAKMTIVKESIAANEINASTSAPVLIDDFSATAAGTMRQVSWGLYVKNSVCQDSGDTVALLIGGDLAGGSCDRLSYGNYYYVYKFNDHKSRLIQLSKHSNSSSANAAAAVVFTYSLF